MRWRPEEIELAVGPSLAVGLPQYDRRGRLSFHSARNGGISRRFRVQTSTSHRTSGVDSLGALSRAGRRLASPRTAIVLVGLTPMSAETVVAFSLLNHDLETDLTTNLQPVAVCLALPGVGFGIVQRQPGNTIG